MLSFAVISGQRVIDRYGRFRAFCGGHNDEEYVSGGVAGSVNASHACFFCDRIDAQRTGGVSHTSQLIEKFAAAFYSKRGEHCHAINTRAVAENNAIEPSARTRQRRNFFFDEIDPALLERVAIASGQL